MFEDHTEARDLEMDQDALEPLEMGVEGQDFYYEDLTGDSDSLATEEPAASTEESGFYEGLDKTDATPHDPALDQSSDDLMDA